MYIGLLIKFYVGRLNLKSKSVLEVLETSLALCGQRKEDGLRILIELTPACPGLMGVTAVIFLSPPYLPAPTPPFVFLLCLFAFRKTLWDLLKQTGVLTRYTIPLFARLKAEC